MREDLNASPWFKVLVLAFMTVLAPFLIRKGVRGIRDKRIVGKYGRVYTGKMAVISGVLFVLTGVMLIVGVVGIALKAI